LPEGFNPIDVKKKAQQVAGLSCRSVPERSDAEDPEIDEEELKAASGIPR